MKPQGLFCFASVMMCFCLVVLCVCVHIECERFVECEHTAARQLSWRLFLSVHCSYLPVIAGWFKCPFKLSCASCIVISEQNYNYGTQHSDANGMLLPWRRHTRPNLINNSESVVHLNYRAYAKTTRPIIKIAIFLRFVLLMLHSNCTWTVCGLTKGLLIIRLISNQYVNKTLFV